MKNIKTKRKIKSILNYLSTVFTWAIFVILIICAGFLIYYYTNMKSHENDKTEYIPEISLYTIVSGSMVPKINVYDVIVNKRVESPMDIKIGDIITFTSTSSISSGMTVTHRVIDIQNVNGEYQFITKGDANISQDGAPALYSNVIGKAVLKIPQLGRVQFFVASKFGWLIVVVLPALYVIIKDIYKIVKITRMKNEAEAANEQTRMQVEAMSNVSPPPVQVVTQNAPPVNTPMQNITQNDIINSSGGNNENK